MAEDIMNRHASKASASNRNLFQLRGTYKLQKGKSVRAMAHAIEAYLMYDEGMTCQVLRTPQGEYIVQGKDRNERIMRWAGLGQTIAVCFMPLYQDTVIVKMEKSSMLGKSLLLAAGLLLFMPLAAASLYGMIRQALLPAKLTREIQRCLDKMNME